MGKTLIVYYTLNEKVRRSFEASRRPGQVEVLELRERYDRSVLDAATIGVCQALAGRGSRIDPLQVDMTEYDNVILATPVWAGQPAPAVNAFLHGVDFMGRKVCAMLLTKMGAGLDCGNVVRRRIASAGGVCRDVLTVRCRDLYVPECDVCALAKAELHPV